MAAVKTINFLPEIFRSNANTKFLNATLDQLVSEPSLDKINGYVGRQFSPTYKTSDNYIIEPSARRQVYQLEPTVVVNDPNGTPQFLGTYIDLLQKLEYYGAYTGNQDRLFAQENYSFNPLIDFDKFINFSQYYWLPYGPNLVSVSAAPETVLGGGTVTATDLMYSRTEKGFTVSYNNSSSQENPTLYLERGITYTFNPMTTGTEFWIQTEPGLSGTKKTQPGVSTRDVLGVNNNGATNQAITFTVPLATAQDQYVKMAVAQPLPGKNVTFACELAFSQIHNQLLSQINLIGGISGNTTTNKNNIDGKFLVFLPVNATTQVYSPDGLFDYDPEGYDGFKFDGGRAVPPGVLSAYQVFDPWAIPGAFDKYRFGEDNIGFDEGLRPDVQPGDGAAVDPQQRYGIWRISATPTSDGLDTLIQLSYAGDINFNNKVYITSGLYSGFEFYKDSSGLLSKVPAITAPLDTFYYQDGMSEMLAGQIKIIDPLSISLDVEEKILGQTAYTSPNGIEFTNGMLIQFDSTVTPAKYTNGLFYVEGVGTGIVLSNYNDLATPDSGVLTASASYDASAFDVTGYDAAAGTGGALDYITINRSSIDGNAWSRSNRWFHIDVIKKTAEYNKTVPLLDQVKRANRPIIEFNPHVQLFNHGRQFKSPVQILTTTVTDAFNQIENKPIGTELDGTPLDAGLRIIFANNVDKIYRNKIFVIKQKEIAGLKTIHLVQDSDSEILEGHQVLVTAGANIGMAFYYNGTDWIESQKKYGVNQAPLFDMFDQDGNSFADANIYYGSTFTGTKIFSYGVGSGTVDYNLGFPLKYRNFNQIGDIVFDNNYDIDSFTYLVQNVTVPVKINSGYAKINNGLDKFVYSNNWYTNTYPSRQYQVITNFYTDTRYFEVDINPMSATMMMGGGHTKVFVNNKYIGANFTETNVKRIKTIVINDNVTLSPGDKIDILIHSLDVSKMGYYQIPDNLDYNAQNQNFSELTLGQMRNHISTKATNALTIVGPVPGPSNLRDIDIRGSSGSILQHSSSMLYQSLFVTNNDTNLFNSLEYAEKEYNKFKNKFLELSVKNNYDTTNAGKTVDAILTEINKVKNASYPWYYSDMVPYGDNFKVARPTYTIYDNGITEIEISSIFNNYVSSNKALLVYYTSQAVSGKAAFQAGSNVIAVDITSLSNYSQLAIPTYTQRAYIGTVISGDGIPPGTTIIGVDVNTFTIILSNPVTTTGVFKITTTPTTRLLVLGNDYIFNQTRPTIVLDPKFYSLIGDMIDVVEYTSTDGNYIPETPTKLGLYPKFTPGIFLDETYQTPVKVIQGHDGSLTPAFGDFRDELLLELETRIYNNIKLPYRSDLFNISELTPGKFRATDYTLKEYNQVLTRSFLRWVGEQQIDFTSNNTFDGGNPWTWNYSKTTDSINGERLPGFWRGIFKYFYDTDRPHTHPWEMFGFSEQPAWWLYRYGEAPYTGKNSQLWEDVETGFIADPANPRYDIKFARPGIYKSIHKSINFLPVDEFGILRPPSGFISADTTGFNAGGSFAIGDCGPVEAAWRRSSSYPYAVQRTMALLKPAAYFGKLINVNKYSNNNPVGQFLLTNTNQRIKSTDVAINGETVNGTISRTAGYINYISDYLKSRGIDPYNNTGVGVSLRNYLDNITIQLGYKVGGFTDKKLLKTLAEHSSPSSTNTSIIIPDDNYKIILNKSTPIKKFVYSAVIVQISETGYTVSGYNSKFPYFTIIPSITNGNAYTITQLNESGIIYRDYQNLKLTVPYGYEFKTRQQVVDFLVSYGRYLTSQGINFDDFDPELQQRPDFVLSANEFLAWSQQGWKKDNLIVLSPINNTLSLITRDSVVDAIDNSLNGSRLLDQQFGVIRTSDLSVVRDDTNFSVTSINKTPICLAELDLVQYEHVLLFDNTTVFNDVIYSPALGNRQSRLRLVGSKTADWTGKLAPPGFIYSSDKFQTWQVGRDYRKGELVEYKNNYYVALDDVTATDRFKATEWKSLDKAQIKSGLLPNFATNAQQFESFYDADERPVSSSLNKFGSGLVGFRARNYLSDLNIDEGTQLKFYQGLLKQKGTKNSIDALTTATFSNMQGALDLYEEWAIRVGEFGALDTNQYFEVNITPDVSQKLVWLNNDPNQIQKDTVIVTNETLNKKSNLYQPTFSKNRDRSTYYQDDIATAGFVNLADIDDTIFNLQNYKNLDSVLSKMGSGYKIWTAKDFSGNWNVYRVSETNNYVSSLSYALDNLMEFETVAPHGLTVGEVIAVKNLDTAFNGVYRVSHVTDLTHFNVLTTTEQAKQLSQSAINGNGTLLKMESMRFSNLNDIKDYIPMNGWKAKDKIWVENATSTGEWGVFNKTTSFLYNTSIAKRRSDYIPQGNENFGYAVALNSDNSLMFVGEPGNASGTVRVYSRSKSGDYAYATVLLPSIHDFTYSATLTPSLAESEKYGAAVALGHLVGVVGIPAASRGGIPGIGAVEIYQQVAANVLALKQTIVPPNYRGDTNYVEFGWSVAVSQDDRWIYVGAPGDNAVHCYGLQYAEAKTDTLDVNPNQSVYTLPFTPANPDSITIISSRRALVINNDYTLSGNRITFLVTTYTDTLVIIQNSYFAYVDSLKLDDNNYQYSPTDRFGHVVKCNADGTKILVTAPGRNVFKSTGDGLRPGQIENSDTAVGAGQVFTFDRSVEKFVANGKTNAFTPRYAIPTIYSVKKNGVTQQAGLQNDYYIGNGTVFFLKTPDSGDVIEIDTNNFNLIDAISAPEITPYAEFGSSADITKTGDRIVVGAPYYSEGAYRSGLAHTYYDRTKVNVINGMVPNPVSLVDSSLKINGAFVNFPIGADASRMTTLINQARIPGVVAALVNRAITVNDYTVTSNHVKTSPSAQLVGTFANFIQITSVSALEVLPDTGDAMTWIGLQSHQFENTLLKPYTSQEQEFFGTAVAIAEETNQILVSSEGATNYFVGKYDTGFTVDQGSTTFFDSIKNSGSVYSYDYLENYNTYSGDYVFGQQLIPTDLMPNVEFGKSVVANKGMIIVGAPNDSTNVVNGGILHKFINLDNTSSWQKIRSEESIVDVSNIVKLFTYKNSTQKIQSYLDYIDPISGKILGVAEQDLDFKTVFDPASYNITTRTDVSNNAEYYWTTNYVGKLWWNLDLIKYIDYRQGELLYRAQNWARPFPGSTIQINEWVQSDVLPSKWVSSGKDGIPLHADDSAYVQDVYVDRTTGVITTKYYFWVSNRTTVATGSNKINSASAVQSLIESPRTQGINYAAFLRNDAFKLFGLENTTDTDIILHVDYSIQNTENLIHTEYNLVQEGNPLSAIPPKIYSKMVDSITGFDEAGRVVPDPTLLASDKIGTSIRPRQTLIKDNIAATENFIRYINSVFIKNPIVERFDIGQFLSEEPVPMAPITDDRGLLVGEWHKQVAVYEDLSYLDLATIPYSGNQIRVLVTTVTAQDNLWAIYSYDSDTASWNLYRIQAYKTPLTWEYADWYDSTYNPTVQPTHVVATYKDVKTIKVSVNDTIKVNNDGKGKFVIYRVNSDYRLDLVGYENATIQLGSLFYDIATAKTGFDGANFDTLRFDHNTSVELRNIMKGIQDNIFVGYLANEFSNLFFVLVNYILSEQNSVDWIFKTSFISVVHKLRKLAQYPSYISDNQTYYEDYINEVKPYRTKIREYLLNYSGTDVVPNDITDYDPLVKYNFNTGHFYKPELPTGVAEAAKFSIAELQIAKAGTGYSSEPVITISAPGGLGKQAKARVVIDYVTGKIIDTIIIDAGSGYTTTPVVTVDGNGSGAILYAQLGNSPVRSMLTHIKFDRISYNSPVKRWPGTGETTTYHNGDIVSAEGTAYQAYSTVTVSNKVFNPSLFTKVDASTFTNANDRITSYYYSSLGQPDLDLKRLVSGVDYPGNYITGLKFLENKGEIEVNLSVRSDSVSGSRNFEWWAGNATITNVSFTADGTQAPNLPTKTYGSGDLTLVATPNLGYRNQVVWAPLTGYLKDQVVRFEGKYYTARPKYPPYVSLYTDNTCTTFSQCADEFVEISLYPNAGSYLVDSISNTGITLLNASINQQLVGTSQTDGPGYFLKLVYNIPAPYLDQEDTYIDGAKFTDGEPEVTDVILDGGKFYDTYSSHAPEELIPGVTYDSLVMKVFTQTQNEIRLTTGIVIPAGTLLGYVQTIDHAGNFKFTRIRQSNTTTLAQDLNALDTSMVVTDATVLPNPDTVSGRPGIVCVNGEIIKYLELDRETNTISRLIRGANKTGWQTTVTAGTVITDIGDNRLLLDDKNLFWSAFQLQSDPDPSYDPGTAHI